jgi:hypothetical protein
MRRNWKKWGMETIPSPACRAPLRERIRLGRLAATFCRFATLLTAASLLTAPALPAEQKPDKPYALIFGTVWGPDDHPLYGVKVKIRQANGKKAHWELASDHHGEFALRVPPGPSDYLVRADLKGFKSPTGKELHQDGEVKVHLDKDERQDIGLHLKQ